jgi:hypothetical protein
MITITLKRNKPQGNAVTGTLAFDLLNKDYDYERREFKSLENADFLIPAGTYPLERTFSLKFQKMLPEVQDVPDRSGIRIHRGTIPEHSKGCILLNMEGMACVDTLFNQRNKYYEDEKIQIQIIESDAA